MAITLSDDDLEAAVVRLARSEREATSALIAHLGELHARRLDVRAGFASLFTYCTTVLRLSEHEAYDRMKAAKVARRYPEVLPLLEAGRVNLTTIRLLAPHLTRANQAELFAQAVGKNKRQVQELLARRFPMPDAPVSIRKLPRPVVAAASPAANAERTEAPVSEGVVSAAEVTGQLVSSSDISSTSLAGAGGEGEEGGPPLVARTRPTPASSPRPLVQPLAPDRYRIHFTGSERLCDKLELARDLLRHAVPSGDPAEIIERALDELIARAVKARYASTPRPRPPAAVVGPRNESSRPVPADEPRYIPAHVKRAVYIRDGGRCAYIGPGSHRCAERALVEFHHVAPYVTGGRATVANIELRCRAHNAYEAEAFFGPARSHVPGDTEITSAATTGRTGAEATDAAAVSAATRFRSGTNPSVDWRTPLRM